MDFDFKPTATDTDALRRYADLFAACFPKAAHLDTDYLTWLYRDNPEGPVVGFDAFDNGRLAAHYVCIPTRIRLRGTEIRALLSLNTATHPEYQGKGLFTKLASLTYDQGRQDGFAAVYGVANAQSAPGFIRKLGFTLVAPLQARIGFGDITVSHTKTPLDFERVWSEEALGWRAANPHNRLHAEKSGEAILGRTPYKIINAYAPLRKLAMNLSLSREIGARLFLGLLPQDAQFPRGYVSIPDQLKPSPLNFIYRPLASDAPAPDAARSLFTFIDFDAY